MKLLLTLALVAAMTGSVSAQKQQTLHSGYPSYKRISIGVYTTDCPLSDAGFFIISAVSVLTSAFSDASVVVLSLIHIFDIEQAIRLIANTETNNTTVKIFENFIIITPLLFRFCLLCFQFLRFRLLFF